MPEMCAILGGRERGKHKARGKKGKHDRKRIRIRDTNVRKEMKENFYHGILLGLFAGMAGWKVKSNAEAVRQRCNKYRTGIMRRHCSMTECRPYTNMGLHVIKSAVRWFRGKHV